MSGLQFPFRVPGTFPRPATIEESVEQSLTQLALVGPGERVMRPGVESRLRDLIFEDNDELLGELVRTELTVLYTTYEPRAQILGIEVTRDPDRGVVDVAVEYLILATGRREHLTLSLPVETEGLS